MRNKKYFRKAVAAVMIAAAVFHVQGCTGKKEEGPPETAVGAGEESRTGKEAGKPGDSRENGLEQGEPGPDGEQGRAENKPEDGPNTGKGSKENPKEALTDMTGAVLSRWKAEKKRENQLKEKLPPLDGIKVIIGTDLHYLSGAYTDYGEAFQHMVDYGDGRIVTYIDQITDEFLKEVIEEEPDVLVLSGDLTSNGEKKSHEELAEKLQAVEDEGITVLVIPGNHDINNRSAKGYKENGTYPVEYTTPEQFAEIYSEFGYDEAAGRDEGTLSYVYQLDENVRFLMLDTCQYHEGFARVGGAILTDTYDWIDRELEDAWENDMYVIPVAHHNLLDESEVYVDDCTIEHSSELIERLEGWEISLFLSGHLHVQHMMEREGASPLREIVTSSLTTPDCQYGILTYQDNENYDYETRKVDVERWAIENESSRMDLLEFQAFSRPFLRRVFQHQAEKALKKIEDITEDERAEMCQFYAELNDYYYQGRAVEIRKEAVKDPAFYLWQEKAYGTVLIEYILYILDDGVRDYNTLYVRDGETLGREFWEPELDLESELSLESEFGPESGQEPDEE